MSKKIFKLLCGLLLINWINIASSDSTCFSQDEFESAFSVAFNQFEDIEALILDSLSMDGSTLDAHDPIYNHFKSHKLSWDILSRHKFAKVANMALKALKIDKNYTKIEYQACLDNIVTNKFCTPIPVNCNASSTK